LTNFYCHKWVLRAFFLCSKVPRKGMNQCVPKRVDSNAHRRNRENNSNGTVFLWHNFLTERQHYFQTFKFSFSIWIIIRRTDYWHLDECFLYALWKKLEDTKHKQFFLSRWKLVLTRLQTYRFYILTEIQFFDFVTVDIEECRLIF